RNAAQLQAPLLNFLSWAQEILFLRHDAASPPSPCFLMSLSRSLAMPFNEYIRNRRDFPSASLLKTLGPSEQDSAIPSSVSCIVAPSPWRSSAMTSNSPFTSS